MKWKLGVRIECIKVCLLFNVKTVPKLSEYKFIKDVFLYNYLTTKIYGGVLFCTVSDKIGVF